VGVGICRCSPQLRDKNAHFCTGLALWLDPRERGGFKHNARPWYRRLQKPPLLAIWGKHDLYFISAGAEDFRRDNPNATVQFSDTGHFALETPRRGNRYRDARFFAKLPTTLPNE
jgi:pimeloyl-ACP methyl ester carboxylesterase